MNYVFISFLIIWHETNFIFCLYRLSMNYHNTNNYLYSELDDEQRAILYDICMLLLICAVSCSFPSARSSVVIEKVHLLFSLFHTQTHGFTYTSVHNIVVVRKKKRKREKLKKWSLKTINSLTMKMKGKKSEN